MEETVRFEQVNQVDHFKWKIGEPVTEPGQRLAFLAEVSRVLASSLDYEITLQNLSHLLVPHLADWCSIDVIQEDEQIRSVGVAHSNLAREALVQELAGRYWTEFIRPEQLVTQAVTTGKSILISQLDPAQFEQPFYQPEHRRLVQELGMQSVMIVPLVAVARQQILGQMMLVISDSPRRYTQADLEIAEELGQRATLALDNAHLYQKAQLEIAERKRAEEELGRSEERYRLLAETVPQLVWRTRPDGYNDYFNNRWYTYTGQIIEESRGDGWQSVLHPDDRTRTRRTWYKAVETGQPYVIEYRLRGKDDIYRWFLVRGLPVKDEAGQITAWFGTCTEIDDQKRLEQEQHLLIEASKLLSSSLNYDDTLNQLTHLAVNNLADWCIIDIVEEDGSYRRAAGSHAEPARQYLMQQLQERYLAGPNKTEGVSKVISTGQSELISKVSDGYLQASPQDVRMYQLDILLNPKSLMIVPLVARNRVFGALTLGLGEGLRRYGSRDLALAEELGRRAALALDNARLYNEAQDALRLREAFLNITAHELRTPLTVIKGWLQVSEREMDKAAVQPEKATAFNFAKVRRRLLQALAHTNRAERLLENMSYVTELLDSSFQLDSYMLDLPELVLQTITGERAFSPQIEISLKISQAVPANLQLKADSLKLSKALSNLLDNAVKFSSQEGKVEVNLDFNPAHQKALIAVHDNGPGITTTDRKQLFKPFYRGEPDYHRRRFGGLGLGLFVAEAIIKAHAGQLYLAEIAPNQNNTGSTFVISLPINSD